MEEAKCGVSHNLFAHNIWELGKDWTLPDAADGNFIGSAGFAECTCGLVGLRSLYKWDSEEKKETLNQIVMKKKDVVSVGTDIQSDLGFVTERVVYSFSFVELLMLGLIMVMCILVGAYIARVSASIQ